MEQHRIYKGSFDKYWRVKEEIGGKSGKRAVFLTKRKFG